MDRRQYMKQQTIFKNNGEILNRLVVGCSQFRAAFKEGFYSLNEKTLG